MYADEKINLKIKNDISNFYIEKGQGYPLILLHGNGENSNYFKNQINELSKMFHVYAVDTRGHGNTLRGNKTFSIRQFADDLLCFMNEHKIEKANVLGFSDGGNTAIIFAIKYPDRVNRLILNGANLNPNGVKRTVQIPIELGYKIAKMFSYKNNSAKHKEEMLGLMVNDPNISQDELARIKSKTLVIAGTNDMIKETHTKLIADNIPDSKLVLIKGDHFIANKNYIEFNQVVINFLEE